MLKMARENSKLLLGTNAEDVMKIRPKVMMAWAKTYLLRAELMMGLKVGAGEDSLFPSGGFPGSDDWDGDWGRGDEEPLEENGNHNRESADIAVYDLEEDLEDDDEAAEDLLEDDDDDFEDFEFC